MSVEIVYSRSYVHKTCGQVTEVGGDDFKNLACPVPGMKGAICSACESVFPISEFRWQDSDEGLTDYYNRYRAQIPRFTRLICSRLFSWLSLVIGLLTGIGIGTWSGRSVGMMLGVVIGAVAMPLCGTASLITWDMLTEHFVSLVLEVPDVRSLS